LGAPTHNRLYFYSQITQGGGTGNKGWIANAGSNSQINFTAQHKCVPFDESRLDEYKTKLGSIVVASGQYYNMFNVNNQTDPTKIQVDECLPTFKLSNTVNDKKAFGVLSSFDQKTTTINIDGSTEDVSEFGWGTMRYSSNGDYTDKPRFKINSGGEGAVLVSNYSSTGANNVVEAGDYITTCLLEGLGMKQSDDILHNYTVAKALNSEDFTSGFSQVTHGGITYKYKLVGCTYHCG
jgi:hypothetical protein